MQVKEIMTKKLVSCQEDDTISQVLSKMRQNSVHQLLVLNSKELKGMIILNDIVKREFDVSTTKASSILRTIPTIRSDASIEDAAELIVNANVRALPVVDRELLGVVSESDIIKQIKLDFDVEETAEISVCVNDSDNVGKIKNIFVQKNLSRVPVMKNGRLAGVVGTMELVNIIEQGRLSKESRGWGLKTKAYKEKLNIDLTLAGSVMKAATSLRKPVKSDQVLKMLKTNDEIFIVNGDVKIVTPKDVLKLLIIPKKTTYFQISGLEDEDAMTVAKIHKIIESAVKQISKVNEIQPLHMFIEHHKKGGKIKYSIKAQLPTQLGTIIVSKVWGYNIITTMQEAMNNLEREFWKKYDKLKGRGKATKRLARGK